MRQLRHGAMDRFAVRANEGQPHNGPLHHRQVGQAGGGLKKRTRRVRAHAAADVHVERPNPTLLSAIEIAIGGDADLLRGFNEPVGNGQRSGHWPNIDLAASAVKAVLAAPMVFAFLKERQYTMPLIALQPPITRPRGKATRRCNKPGSSVVR